MRIVACLLVVIGSATAWGGELRVLPEEFTLYGANGRQRVAAAKLRDGRVSAKVADDQITLSSSDDSVVEVRDDVALAKSDGEAVITATSSHGATATARVRVIGTGKARRPSFRNDVVSILSKVGCNAGACHGALAGKGGFKLSLRGYDPAADFLAITREARGRRIELADPGRSLLLAKPTGAVPHKGGLKLDAKSRDYALIAEWLAAGAPGPQDGDPRLERISVLPESALVAPGEQSQLLVAAHYDDGRTIDVTHWARFTATDEAIAGVDDDGLVTVRGSGEGAVLVWFGSKVALGRLTSPYPHDVPPQVYADAPRRNFIDELNLAQLKMLRLRPSPRCDDETFIRRATIDAVGRLPTIAERDQFLGEPPDSRRDELIERLLASDDYADYWAYRFSDVLVINGTRLRPKALKTYYDWVHEAVQRNMPWDEFVRSIITAVGESDEVGPTNFYALHQSPEEMTENACQAFLGLSIGCAKCHNHPLEKWTNDQYYSMANLFARVRAKGWGGESRSGDGLRTLYVSHTGELIQPSRGKPQPPAPLDAEPLAFDDPRDRREALARWMTSPENPYFARAIANRVWANFFGRGLVEAVDDLRLSNPASNEPLLAATADYLVEVDFDLKQFMRTILQSETYQRTSAPLPENRADQKYNSRYYPRRLMAEVLLDAIDQTLDTTTRFDRIAFPGADFQQTDFYDEGTRAIELYDSAVDSYFLKTFGRNPREITCECQRSDEPSMVQVLHLSNGDTLNPKLANAENRIAQLIAAGADNREIVRTLFLAALAREPTDEEFATILPIVYEYGAKRATGLRDAAWGVLTSPEFTFNH